MLRMKQALIIVDHGSRLEAANEMLDDVVAMVQGKRPDLVVVGAHMELAAPSISEAVEGLVQQGVLAIVVQPYMLSPGRHATCDIPAEVDALAERYKNVSFSCSGPLGVHEVLALLVLERAGL